MSPSTAGFRKSHLLLKSEDISPLPVGPRPVKEKVEIRLDWVKGQ